MPHVIRLLAANMSPFAPDAAEHDAIWSAFTAQAALFAVVACLADEVVGYGSVLIETKIRGGRVGHIEDIVSAAAQRRRGVGRRIMAALREIACEQQCYRIVLACEPHAVPFYVANGYEPDGVAMVNRLRGTGQVVAPRADT